MKRNFLLFILPVSLLYFAFATAAQEKTITIWKALKESNYLD